MSQKLVEIPESVRQDTLAYRSQVAKYLAGQTQPVMFKAYRVPMGVYEQRQSGSYMVRIRVTAGVIQSAQAGRVAQLSRKYGNGVVHVTTRQDLQIHEVALENTPDVIESLLKSGLSTRGGGGNTVRNISACVKSGFCGSELFDVSPYAVALTEYLIADRRSFNLPRKYKIAFSGCKDDCAFASVTDLGFFAAVKDGRRGFAVYAGGGLGPNARVADQIEEFVRQDDIFDVAIAIRNVFDMYGDRINRNKARLRYVVERLGISEFRRLYREQRELLSKERAATPTLPPEDAVPTTHTDAVISDNQTRPGVHPQRQEGMYSIHIGLQLGDISVDDLEKLADIALRHGDGHIRTVQSQDLVIAYVKADNVQQVLGELATLNVDVKGEGLKIVTCTGSATCKLGLCLSRGLAGAIDAKLAETGKALGSNLAIRISGCPNSCGGHLIAEIGLQGRAQRVGGQLLPSYEVFQGGRVEQGNARLGRSVGTLPAKAVPAFVSELVEGQTSRDRTASLLAKYAAMQVMPDFYYDFGATNRFSLAGRGPGECGAGVTDVIRLDIDEARDLLKQPLTDEAIYKAVLAAARALLVTYGLEPGKDREVFDAFKEHLVKPGWVRPQAAELVDAALDWRMGQLRGLSDRVQAAGELIERIGQLFMSLGADLKFRVEPYSVAGNVPQTKAAESTGAIVDLRGVKCPLNFVKAKVALEKVPVGGTLEILLDEGEPIQNVPASFADQGQEVLEVKKVDGHHRLTVKRVH